MENGPAYEAIFPGLISTTGKNNQGTIFETSYRIPTRSFPQISM